MSTTRAPSKSSFRTYARARVLAAIVALELVLSACAESTDDEPRASAPGSGNDANVPLPTRQTDAHGRPLPFRTEHPQRWSDLNNGTDYEPCTALTMAEIHALDVDPDSVRDAAIANHQTARGCIWRLRNSAGGGLVQALGNDLPLQQYKAKRAVVVDWQPDIVINGRTVAVGHGLGDTECHTEVQSGTAIITTTVSIPTDTPPIDEICARAIAFTRATIVHMPV
ncbi:MAG: DUF3558 family protein [Gordonia sp. (in: high G+C Gram-positive bacteria)]